MFMYENYLQKDADFIVNIWKIMLLDYVFLIFTGK